MLGRQEVVSGEQRAGGPSPLGAALICCVHWGERAVADSHSVDLECSCPFAIRLSTGMGDQLAEPSWLPHDSTSGGAAWPASAPAEQPAGMMPFMTPLQPSLPPYSAESSRGSSRRGSDSGSDGSAGAESSLEPTPGASAHRSPPLCTPALPLRRLLHEGFSWI